MNHDVHTFFASRARARVRVRTSSAALARRVCGTRDRGIALASSVLCFTSLRMKDFRLGVVTLASRRTVRHWVWHASIVQSAILCRVSSTFIIEHNKESRTTSAAPSLKSQESRVKSRVKTAKFCAQRSVGVYLRQVFVCWWYPALRPVGTADGGLESSTVDGSVTLFAGSAMASHVCQSQMDLDPPGLFCSLQ